MFVKSLGRCPRSFTSFDLLDSRWCSSRRGAHLRHVFNSAMAPRQRIWQYSSSTSYDNSPPLRKWPQAPYIDLIIATSRAWRWHLLDDLSPPFLWMYPTTRFWSPNTIFQLFFHSVIPRGSMSSPESWNFRVFEVAERVEAGLLDKKCHKPVPVSHRLESLRSLTKNAKGLSFQEQWRQLRTHKNKIPWWRTFS